MVLLQRWALRSRTTRRSLITASPAVLSLICLISLERTRCRLRYSEAMRPGFGVSLRRRGRWLSCLSLGGPPDRLLDDAIGHSNFALAVLEDLLDREIGHWLVQVQYLNKAAKFCEQAGAEWAFRALLQHSHSEGVEHGCASRRDESLLRRAFNVWSGLYLY